MNIESYLDLVKKAVLSHIDCSKYTVFLFGSRADGSADSMSDIDVGILGNHKLPALMRYEIENSLYQTPVPLKIDLVDFFNISPKFKQEALKNIQLWNLSKDTEQI